MIYLVEQMENLVMDWQKNVQNGSETMPLAEVCGILSEELRQKIQRQSGPKKLLFYSDIARMIMIDLKPEDQKKAKDFLACDRYDLKSLLEHLKGKASQKSRQRTIEIR